MTDRTSDGSAGDADYGVIGLGYALYRRPEPAIAAIIHRALGDARTVLNVGAGAGSYEPRDRDVVAVEPSAAMRAQRPAHLAPAIDARAEHLPFADKSFDAAMASSTVHQWARLEDGLKEMRRVTPSHGSEPLSICGGIANSSIKQARHTLAFLGEHREPGKAVQRPNRWCQQASLASQTNSKHSLRD